MNQRRSKAASPPPGGGRRRGAPSPPLRAQGNKRPRAEESAPGLPTLQAVLGGAGLGHLCQGQGHSSDEGDSRKVAWPTHRSHRRRSGRVSVTGRKPAAPRASSRWRRREGARGWAPRPWPAASWGPCGRCLAHGFLPWDLVSIKAAF